MWTKTQLTKAFHNAVLRSPYATSELKSKLTRGKYERTETFLTNLRVELEKAVLVFIRKHKRKPNPQTVQSLIQDMTDIFCKNIERHADQMKMSDLAKSLIEKKAQEQAELESTVNGKAAGVFEEMGVISNEQEIAPREG